MGQLLGAASTFLSTTVSALEGRVDSAGTGHVKPGMAPMMGMMPPGR